MALFVIIFVVILVLAVLIQLSASEIVRGVLQPQSILTSPPTKLSKSGVTGLFVLVLLKYAVRSFGKFLGLLPSLQYDESAREYELPLCSVSAPLRGNDEDSIKYCLAVSSTDPHGDNSRNPLFLLAPLTNPLLLHLLTKYTNPILPLGAVNVRNRFEFIDPDACQRLRYPQTGKLEAIATMGGRTAGGKVVKRGMEFDITVLVSANGKPIFKEVFTVLQFLRHKHRAAKSEASESRRQEDVPNALIDAEGQMMKVDFNAPGRWAQLCKDYNPIHISSLAAQLFGFPGKIAHGNLVVGMALEQYLYEKVIFKGKPSYLEVEFRRPMVVPMTAVVKVLQEQLPRASQRVLFRVASMDKTGLEKSHVEGRMGVL